MQSIKTHMEVRGPVNRVYDQWKRFENVPFAPEHDGDRQVSCDPPEPEMGSNDPVVQYDPPRLAIGARSRRTVAFHPTGDGATRITVSLDCESQANVEDIGRYVAATTREIRDDLERFREFLRDNGDGNNRRARSGAQHAS